MGGFGTTATFIVAGLLWLFYFVPGFRERREYEHTRRALDLLNGEVRPLRGGRVEELTPKEIIARAKQVEHDAKVAERGDYLRERMVLQSADPEFFGRIRRAKLGVTLLAFTGLAGAIIGSMVGLLFLSIIGFGVVVFAGVGLVSLNNARPQETHRVATPKVKRATPAQPTANTWVPNRTPKPHRSVPAGAGLINNPENERAVAARERAARLAAQAALAAEVADATIPTSATSPAALIDPRFAAASNASLAVNGAADNGNTTSGAAFDPNATQEIDITAALRARRA